MIIYLVKKYNTGLHDFITTTNIRSDIAALVPMISSYDNEQPQTSNYYFPSNILRYLWDKFWEEKPECRIEIKGNELIQIPGERRISQ
ncbi:MAG: hypothetical protein WBF33_18360 [Candidatus Nitrosopolaris sp.]